MFRPGNQLVFIRKTLYSLKRDYGTPLDIYQFKSIDVDPKTGKRTSNRIRIQVRKAILLPSVLARKFSTELAFLSANRNFSYGNVVDTNSRLVIVEANDLPPDTEITNDNYLVMNGRDNYEIQQVDRLEHGYGFLLTVKHTVGSPAGQVLSQSVTNLIRFSQNTQGEV